jgi:predicted  nucleic acid-binding Zn-ribbon protein
MSTLQTLAATEKRLNNVIAEIVVLREKLAHLTEERDEWKRRAELAAHVKADDRVGFDWEVLGMIEKLQRIEKAAESLMNTFDEFGNFNYSSEYIDALAAALAEKG